MAIENEELMQKLVRTGMIMRHIDGEGQGSRHMGMRHEGPRGGHGEGYGRPDEARFEAGGRAVHAEGERGHGRGHGCDPEGPHGPKGHGKRHHGQARVLAMISLQEGINQKDLAFLLGVRPQTLGEMLQKLEERGMVERKRSEADGRAIEVTLTDEGRARAAEIAERRALAAADMFAVLTSEEKEQLSAILDKLGGELDRHRPKRHCPHVGKPERAQE